MAAKNKAGLRRALVKMGNESLKTIAQNLSDPTEYGRTRPTDPVQVPQTSQQTKAGGRTDIYTMFSRAGGGEQLIYSAEKWTKIRMMLENAGPVAISTRQEILPVLSGRGVLLPTNQIIEFTLSPGDRLYMASNTVNRVQMFIEPFPWLESMLLTLRGILGR